jgi:hypothetical protein
MAKNRPSADRHDSHLHDAGVKTHDQPVRFPRFMFTFLGAVVRHPELWTTALRQLVGTVPRAWWRCPPYLPLPDAGYLKYRVDTAYGATGRPVQREIVSYLRWCREHDRSRTRQH